MTIKVLIADDHPLVREGLRHIINKSSSIMEIIAEASNGEEVLNIARKRRVDVFILDIGMPVLNGIETTARLKAMNSENKVIILSVHDSQTLVDRALKNGARGYILKDNAPEEVIQAIQEVHKGRFFLSPTVTKFIVDGFINRLNRRRGDETTVLLTSREKEILQLISEGFTNKEIAAKLHLSLNTVNVHRKNLMNKLGMHKHADLIRYAIKEGISKL